jgi:hypothetical protein
MKNSNKEVKVIENLVERCTPTHVSDHFNEMISNMKIIDATRLSQVLESVYKQGKKDAHSEMKAAIADSLKKTLKKTYGS